MRRNATTDQTSSSRSWLTQPGIPRIFYAVRDDPEQVFVFPCRDALRKIGWSRQHFLKEQIGGLTRRPVTHFASARIDTSPQPDHVFIIELWRSQTHAVGFHRVPHADFQKPARDGEMATARGNIVDSRPREKQERHSAADDERHESGRDF